MNNCFKIVVFAFLTINSFSFAQNYGAWQQIDSLKEARYNHSAIQLTNGNVLVVGGAVWGDAKSCEIYDLTSGRWSEVAKTNFVRGYHQLVMLDSKRILAVGSPVTKSCEIYNPDSNKWALTDSLKVGRVQAQHKVVKLLDGRILVIGGKTYDYPKLEEQTLRMCEVYDENTGKWSIADSMKVRRSGHNAMLLKDGRVLVVGGNSSSNLSTTCEIYEPVQNKWNDAASLNIPKVSLNAVLLPNGKLLVIGRYGSNVYPQRSCELYDPVNNRWEIVDSTKIDGSMFILDEKNLLIVSSRDFQDLVWEIYDYVEFRSKHVGYLKTLSFNNTITKLKDGRVLATGGVKTINFESYFPIKTCWIFDKNLTHVEDINSQPDNDIFFQNYPNPFNPTTRISFTIPEKSQIKLKVFDVLGREVTNLADGVYEAGKYEVIFDASKLPSGIYFYNLTTGTNSTTKKMMLIK